MVRTLNVSRLEHAAVSEEDCREGQQPVHMHRALVGPRKGRLLTAARRRTLAPSVAQWFAVFGSGSSALVPGMLGRPSGRRAQQREDYGIYALYGRSSNPSVQCQRIMQDLLEHGPSDVLFDLPPLTGQGHDWLAVLPSAPQTPLSPPSVKPNPDRA